jgi:DNA topoisomerase-2
MATKNNTKIVPKRKIRISIKKEEPVAQDTQETLDNEDYNMVKAMEAGDYSGVELIDHIYDTPSTYITSAKKSERNVLSYDEGSESFIYEDIMLPYGVESLFAEALVNAADNVSKSRRSGMNERQVGNIEVEMDNHVVSVKNYGLPIPIQKHPDTDLWVPEMILGQLLTSSNYKTERHEAGINGYGSKLINIFSTWFYVEIYDGFNKKHYQQLWENNMRTCHEPKIEKYNNKLSSVKIMYHLEFPKFGYEDKGYPAEAKRLFMRHCFDISLNSMVKINFNDQVIDCRDIRNYAKIFFGEEHENMLVHYEWPSKTKTKIIKGVEIADDGTQPIARLCIVDNPFSNSRQNISFVNSKMTPDGGDHMDALVKQIAPNVIKHAKSKMTKAEASKAKISTRDVCNHLSFILLYRTVNPEWKGQTKSAYIHDIEKGPIKFAINNLKLSKMAKWKTIETLISSVSLKNDLKLVKSDGKKLKNIGNIKGLQDANDAGTERSSECFLLVVEGGSAGEYAKSFINNLRTHDTMGVYELRGKLLNVAKSSKTKLADSKIIENMKKALGLVEETDYDMDENYEQLRYGGVIVLTDADEDGEHIKGLLLNYFHCRFRTLLETGYISWLTTPLIRTYKGKQEKTFYTKAQYKKWCEQTEGSDKWNVKYFKGLGTSTPADVKKDSKNPIYVNCEYDEMAPDNMDLVFGGHKNATNERKNWLLSFQEQQDRGIVDTETVTTFLNEKLIYFSLYDNYRSIPGWDGLKPSQRKVLWASYLKWNWKIGKKTYKELKVAQFAGFVGENTSYHHGEASLHGTIICMAQNFVGSNNLNHLQPRGQFGSRNKGGKGHASPRYIFTAPEWWLPYVYREEDFPILKHVYDDNEKAEPEVFLPIIPISLINGAEGIGTGWSTSIPCHNPMDCVQWLRNRINGEETEYFKPWYRGFIGEIDVERDVRDDGGSINDIEMITTGVFEEVRKNEVEITELPIGTWTDPYDEWLDELLVTYVNQGKGKKKRKALTDKKRYQEDNNKVRFIIEGMINPNENSLKLVKNFSMRNMHLLNMEHKPVRYDTVDEIMEDFYSHRVPYYQKRKNSLISITKEELKKLDMKIRFILAIVEERLIIKNVPKKEILERMDELKIDHGLYTNARLANINKDEVDQLLKEKDIKEKYLEMLMKTSSKKLWLQDLDEFEKEYRRRYPDE